MSDRPGSSDTNRPPPPSRRVLTWWFGPIGLGGFGFGLIGARRPFGEDVLAHPLVVYFIVVGVALMVLRIALARPVPQLIPERTLVVGCVIGAAAFLIGNWLGVHLLGIR